MKTVFTFLVLTLIFQSCVSRKKYNALILLKEKASSKTIKLSDKLIRLQIYNNHLNDSLNQKL